MLESQVRAQRVNAAVGGGAVGAQAALRRVRVEVVPAVGDFLAARLAAPQRRALGGRHEHAVVRVLRRRGKVRALCNNARPQPATNAAAPIACSRAVYIIHIRGAFCLRDFGRRIDGEPRSTGLEPDRGAAPAGGSSEATGAT